MGKNSQKKRGLRSKFSDAFRRQVALEYLSGKESKQEVANRFGLPNKWTVHNFVNWYRQQPEALEPSQPISEAEQNDLQALQARLKEVERQLEYERLRSLGYETMINIAEKELGIEIRKKSDTKQLKP
jgi:transposase-like protein